MENVVSEVVKPWEPPSSDTRLVLLADDTVHTGRSDVGSHLQTCADYAKEHKVWLVSGLIVNQDNLCLVLFGPDGSALCSQAAIHLALPMKGTLKPVNQVQVIHTKIGNIYLCVDADILHPQTLRAAALKGADIVISIQHLDPVDDTPQRLMSSIWNAAQTNNYYVVGLMSASCAVACPAPLTRNKDGYLVKRTHNLPLRFGLNLERLDDVRSHFQIIECINNQLVQKYAKDLGR